jgi:hypothetical protein
MIYISLFRNVNEWSFAISLILVILFYLQYKVYERAIRHQSMVDRFLKDK